jgi:hypothetical protein
MRARFTFVGCGIVAILTVWALAHVLPTEFAFIPPILYALIVFSSGIGSLLVRKHLEKKNRSAEPDTIERELARHAGLDAFIYALVVAVAFGLWLVIAEQFIMALAVYGLVALCVVLFWIRYAMLRHSVNQDE